GNSLGGYAHYWQAFRDHPRLQGGFVWDWVDQGLDKYTADGRHYWGYGGDFGDVQNDRQFCCNGLLFPDRTPHPALCEAKRAQQPFRFTLLEHTPLRVRIESEYLFRETDNERLCWQLCENGHVQQQGEVSLMLEPQGVVELTLSGTLPPFAADSLAWLDLAIVQPQATLWSQADHKVARQQFTLPTPLALPAPVAAATLSEQPDGWRITASNSQWWLDKQSGRITSWQKSGQEQLLAPIMDHFYRAPLDNDIGTSEADHADPHSWIARWQGCGLGQWQHCCLGIAVAGGDIRVSHGYFHRDELLLVSHWHHRFTDDGAMSLEIETELAQVLPSLPRIGLLLHLAEVPARAEWLGRGPHENYPDRLLGADLGRWSLPLEAMHTPYVFPSDNGLRCDTRQLQLGSTTVSGTFHFSASRFSQQQLAAARHQSDLVAEEGLWVCLDGAHMGVGGDDSWSQSVRPEYQLLERRYRWGCTLR
ncbi:MAG: glycoside hydrolase family 2 TIM barrel-domain containing protein, partial [Aeromonas veronii]